MAGTKRSLEERVAHVERELEELKTRVARQEHRPWWEQIVGDFEGDGAFAEIVRLGRKIRRASTEDSQ